MNIVSKDNFKDDFERNRQEIKPDHTNEFNDQSENEETSFDIRDEQQHFPPRNASRRHRKRDLNSDDYQAQEHVQENSHNSHSEKRPGLLGGFVNKQQDTSHREDSAEPARTNDQGEKIRDYAKEHPHEIQNQPKENHSNNRELKSEQQRDQRRDIHNPEKGKDVHRSNINNVSREVRAKQEPHGQFKKSSEKDVNHTRSNNNSYSQEQQHKKVGPIAGGNQINHRENETHPHTNEPNASQRLDHESKKIDQNHRQQPGNTRPDQRHTKFNKKAAAGAAGAAGVAGAVAKHEHDKKQREPLSDKNEKQNHAPQQNDKIPNNNKTTSGAVGAAETRGESQHQRPQHQRPQQPNDRKRPTHEDERHSRNKKAAMGAGAIGAAGAGAAGAHAAKQHNEKNQQPRKTNRNAATGAGAGAAGASASTQTAHTPPNNKRKKGGCLKRLLPLLAALLLLGALAIFGGMYLFNQNNDENHNNKDNQTEVAKNDNASKDKAENDKANKDKEKSTEETTEETNSNETPGASSESSSEQSNQDTTQSDLNQQQNQTQQDPNSQAQTNSNQQTPSNTNQQNQNSASNNNAQSHTVTGNENLYRIAIRYYGSGSPENVEKIRRANGISGNNINNGQQLIIP